MRNKLYLFCAAVLFSTASIAQLTTPTQGGSVKASVSERIGLTDVTISYDRPAVKGREGKIWGELVQKGYNDLGFGTSKAAPWRAGANENTTFTFTTDVKIEGQVLKAGTYGFFIAYGGDDAELIFSKNSTSWGSFFYDPKEDVMHAKVKTQPLAESIDRLKYEFSDETDKSAVVSLSWEKLKIPFKVEVDLVQTQLESFRKELRSNKAFTPDPWVQAAQYAAQNNDLEEALQWSEYSINGQFVGQKNFKTLSTKAMILNKLGKNAEADALMKEALPMGSVQDLHGYGRTLLSQKKTKEALEIFILNDKKNPNNFTTSMGLARGYSANGDFKNALKYATQAVNIAPNKGSKDQAEGFVKKLQEGKDIN